MPRPLTHGTSSRPPEDAGAIRTIESLRHTQSEIRRGIEAFARGNFARMVRLESAGASTTQRLAAIEERLLALGFARQDAPHCRRVPQNG